MDQLVLSSWPLARLCHISDGTITHAALKLDISAASLTHSFIPNIRFYRTGLVNVLASKSQAGERNTGRVWEWQQGNIWYILHQNACKAQSVKHHRPDCEIDVSFTILVWSLSPLYSSSTVSSVLYATDLMRPLLSLTWATGTAWLLSVAHSSAWVTRATSIFCWLP